MLKGIKHQEMNIRPQKLLNFFLVWSLIFCFFWSGLPVFAQEILTNTSISAPQTRSGPTDPKEFEAFIDGFLAKYLRKPFPGAVFVLVKDGKIFFSKGYGYANIKLGKPVIPSRTIFRLGSISKVLTATAVMQLAEQGQLNLKEDVNHYLKAFKIDNKNFRPITTEHLLTHTDGFDVAWTIGAATRCQSELPPLKEFLSKNLPQTVRQPGQLYVYGDAGIALAGYLLEVLSGDTFPQYMEQNLFRPLDMDHSSFLQPLPQSLKPNLAVGYEVKNGLYRPTTFICGKSVPTIALSATAIDMAHFMIAQLQDGRYNNRRILQEATVKTMQQQQFTNFPHKSRLAGSTFGFYERFQNDQRILEHGGSMYGYTSQLSLMPEQNLGFFFAGNYNDDVEIREKLIKAFLDRYYPRQKKNDLSKRVPQLNAEFRQRARLLSGSYRFIRYPQHSIVKLWLVWFGPRRDLRLELNQDGTFTLVPAGTKWVEVEPFLLRYRNSNSYLRFQLTSQGKVTHMSLSNYVFVTYEKLAWYETAQVQLGLLGFCVLVFFLACLFSPVNPFRRQNGDRFLGVTRLGQLLMGCLGVLNLLFMACMLLVAVQLNYWEFFLGMTPLVIALLYLPLVTTGLTTLMPIIAWRVIAEQRWSLVERLSYLLVILASVIFIFLLNYWNLLGFRF